MSEEQQEVVDARIEPPHLVVEVPLSGPIQTTMELQYELTDILDIDSDAGDVTVVDAHWHGLVIEAPDGETEHIDLREIQDE